MIAANLIAENIPHLTLKVKVKKTKQLFLDSCICHLPVISGNRYVGLLSTESVMSVVSSESIVRDIREELQKVFVTPKQHILEVLTTFAEHNLTALAVLEENSGKFLGVITSMSLNHHMTSFFSTLHECGIIMLKLGLKDYSLLEIAGIIEGNNAKILGLFTTVNVEDSRILITLMVNTPDLKHIMATFERYSYDVTIFSGFDYSDNELKDRFDLLMRYLDI